MKKALSIILVIIGIIFVPYLCGYGLNYLMGFGIRDAIDMFMAWLLGCLPILLVLMIGAIIHGGSDDDDDSDGDSGSSTNNMLLLTTIASVNSMTAMNISTSF